MGLPFSVPGDPNLEYHKLISQPAVASYLNANSENNSKSNTPQIKKHRII